MEWQSATLTKLAKKSVRAAAALISVMLLLSAAHAGAAEVPTNVIANGGFENDLTGWTRSDTAAQTAWSNTSNPKTGTFAFNWWHNAGFSVTVSQTVTGLPEGKYSLSGYSQGGGGESVSRLFAETDGAKQTADFRNIGYLQWIETTIPAINVTSGTVTVGFEITGSAGNWGSIDDFTLIRVGDIDAEPAAIVSILPVTAETLIHDEPQLPTVVTAVYSDGNRAQLPVEWDAADPGQYDAIGSFVIEGTVEGDTELRAQATIGVQYRNFDVNQDSFIDAGDLAVISYYMGVSPHSLDEAAGAADLNNDGSLTVDDLTLLTDELLAQE
ncbi:Ig-like domain-containing protein [Paenibacillus sp. LHD-117]|uniref:Ig-like domain-containing protein n=1 Tax=Paenibacillus sp. LHD-117 TaxID=3071412 RepID=UPI0027DFFC70|nr:Ig-like domain-containing protein [Paenibacillus sp. LHD-117]MDQ6419480.1 Ig-like domain-containing protein [Paenibacillus sp. LHD-117]